MPKYRLTDLDAPASSPYKNITADAADADAVLAAANYYAEFTCGRIRVTDLDGNIIHAEVAV